MCSRLPVAARAVCAAAKTTVTTSVGRRATHVHPPRAARARRRDAASAHHRPPRPRTRRRAPGSRTATGRPRADRDGIVVVYPQGIDSTLEPRGRVARRRVLRTQCSTRLEAAAVHRHEPRLRRRLLTRCLPDLGDRLHLCGSHRGRRADRGDLRAVGLRTGTSGSRCSRSTGRSTTGSGTTSIPGKVAGVGRTQRLRRDADHRAVPGDAVVNITKFTYDCPDSAEVEFYSIENGGHAWPGSEFSRSIEAAVGYTTFAINATDLIWDFFRSHQLHPDIATYTARLLGGARCLSVAHRRGQREVGRRSRAHRGERVGRGRRRRAGPAHAAPRPRTTDRSGSPSAGRRPRRPASMPRPQPGV